MNINENPKIQQMDPQFQQQGFQWTLVFQIIDLSLVTITAFLILSADIISGARHIHVSPTTTDDARLQQ